MVRRNFILGTGDIVMNEKTKESLNQGSDDYYKSEKAKLRLSIIEDDPTRAFPNDIYAMIKKSFPDLAGKRICVPACGDNIAVFAFHLLGAKLTASDISERQIYNAKQIADEKKWDIEYLCEDNMNFGKIKNDEFDLVYTSRGVFMWISDLTAMFRNFRRVLKTGGKYILFETHPINRLLVYDRKFELKPEKPYNELKCKWSPHDWNDWRTQDIINSLLNAGFILTGIEEAHAKAGDLDAWWYTSFEDADADNNKKFDWQINPEAALPQYLGLTAVK